MAEITVKVAGLNKTVTIEMNGSCEEALAAFVNATGRAVEGMDFYTASGEKIDDLSGEAPDELIGVRQKYKSNADVTVKVAGLNKTVTIEMNGSCEEALQAFVDATGRAVEGMDFYTASGEKIDDLSGEAPDELIGVRQKYKSNADVTVKVAGLNKTVTVELNGSCEEALQAFVDATGRAVEGMDFYTASGEKIDDLSDEAPSELIGVR